MVGGGSSREPGPIPARRVEQLAPRGTYRAPKGLRGRPPRAAPWTSRGAWLPLAACREVGPEVFFEPDTQESHEEKLQREAAAKAVCARCPVRLECRELVDRLEARISPVFWHGIWAGETKRERKSRRRRPPSPP